MPTIARNVRGPVPEHLSLDAKQANRLGTQIVKDGPYVVKPYENSAGRVVLNVIDTSSEDPDRPGPWTVRDLQEWEDVKPRRKRG